MAARRASSTTPAPTSERTSSPDGGRSAPAPACGWRAPRRPSSCCPSAGPGRRACCPTAMTWPRWGTPTGAADRLPLTPVTTRTPVADLVADPDARPDVSATLTVREEGERYTVNGTSPGPELRATVGDLVEVTLVNDNVTEGTTLHWHGVDVPNAADGVAGVTQDAVVPGEQFVYRFVANEAGTLLVPLAPALPRAGAVGAPRRAGRSSPEERPSTMSMPGRRAPPVRRPRHAQRRAEGLTLVRRGRRHGRGCGS